MWITPLVSIFVATKPTKTAKGDGKVESKPGAGADDDPPKGLTLPRNVKSIDELVKAVDIKDADHKDC